MDRLIEAAAQPPVRILASKMAGCFKSTSIGFSLLVPSHEEALALGTPQVEERLLFLVGLEIILPPELATVCRNLQRLK
jgi:hypothetical protein